MRKLLPVVLLVAVACSQGDAVDSTTTTSSTSSSTSTSVPQETTTTTPSTTSTTPATTTTSTSSTTTTMVGPEGNWADAPLVTTGFGALGWWDGSEWVDAESEGSLPVSGGEDYQVTRLDEHHVTTGGPQATVCEPLELVGVRLDQEELLGEWPDPYGVAISAPWQLQPHIFEGTTDDGTYARFASELLSNRGLDVADPTIKQVIRTDLEGDGVDEALVVAEDVTRGLLMEEGDYSIAFLRKVIEGEVQTAILGETVVLGDEDRFAGAYAFGGAADLNGDGKMEIITSTAFFEGLSVAVWEYVNDDLGPVEVLATGCGA